MFFIIIINTLVIYRRIIKNEQKMFEGEPNLTRPFRPVFTIGEFSANLIVW